MHPARRARLRFYSLLCPLAMLLLTAQAAVASLLLHVPGFVLSGAASISISSSSGGGGGGGGEAPSISQIADAPAGCPANPPAASPAKAGTPNVILILTDDMDLALGGFTPLKKTEKLLSKRGATASNYFIRALL